MRRGVLAAGVALLLAAGAAWWWGRSAAPTGGLGSGPAAAPERAGEPVPAEPLAPLPASTGEAAPGESAPAPAEAVPGPPPVHPTGPETAEPPPAATALVGTVVDDDGRPVAGATVSFADDESSARVHEPSATAQTDDHGEFPVPAIPEVGWWLWVRAAGFPDDLTGQRATHLGHDDPPPRLVLSRGGFVRGQALVKETQAPIDRVRAWIGPPDGAWASTSDDAREGVKLPAGGFRFGPLYPGRYRLTLREKRLAAPAREFELAAGADTDLGVVWLSTGGRMRGRVLAPGGVAPGRVLLHIAPEGPFRVHGWRSSVEIEGQTPEDNHFEISGAPDGEYRLEVLAGRFRGPVLRVRLAEGRIVEQDILLEAAAWATLRVVDADGDPRDGVELRIAQPGGEWENGRVEETARGYSLGILSTGDGGRVRVGPLAPGRWPVEAKVEAEGGAESWVRLGEIELALGENPEQTLRWVR